MPRLVTACRIQRRSACWLLRVTEAEIEVFERWFGELFDELFGRTVEPFPVAM